MQELMKSPKALRCYVATIQQGPTEQQATTVDKVLLQQINGDFESPANPSVTANTAKAYFDDFMSSQMLRLCATHSLASREDALMKRMLEEHQKDSRLFIADEYLTTFSRVGSTNDSGAYFQNFGPIDLGDVRPELRKRPAYSHAVIPPEHQHLIITHSHPFFIKNQVLGPSVIIHPGSLGIKNIQEPIGDLISVHLQGTRRVNAIKSGTFPRPPQFPIWGIVQAGDSIHEPVKLLWIKELGPLTNLDTGSYYAWLDRNVDFIVKARNDEEVDIALRKMGYQVARTFFEADKFWRTPNVFSGKHRNDLLAIFAPNSRLLALQDFIGTYN